LAGKFHLDFKVPPRTSTSSRAEFWQQTDRVLVATSFARSGSRPAAIASAPWDVVIVDEAHHCKNRKTKLWQLVNSLKRRHMFLLTATPVQNNLVELYSLLTLLEPGHLKTEAEFKRQFVTRGNPRDPRNRQRLRELLGEVMIRNTRSLVQIDLPPRYAQTIIAVPGESERQLQAELTRYLRERSGAAVAQECLGGGEGGEGGESDDENNAAIALPRMRLQSLLNALGSHPTAAAGALDKLAAVDPEAARLQRLAQSISRSAKDDKLLGLLRDSHGHKVLVFVNALRTLHRLQELLMSEGIAFSTFSGDQTAAEKDDAVESLRNRVPVMLCTDSGGEGRNLQFADTLINFDLPWNPMRIEQRIGRVHRFGQTQDVFVFNLCTEGSIESRILGLLNDKIRMFELVVGEVGSILGNLEEGEEFESLVLKLWMKAGDEQQLEQSFASLGDALLDAQEEYLNAKNLDDALFGEDFE
jgi:SNF2 family DNA or RNA helicase